MEGVLALGVATVLVTLLVGLATQGAAAAVVACGAALYLLVLVALGRERTAAGTMLAAFFVAPFYRGIDLASGEALATFDWFPGPVQCVAISPRGDELAAASRYRPCVDVWDLPAKERLRLLRPTEVLAAARIAPGAAEALTGEIDVERVRWWRDQVTDGRDDAWHAGWIEDHRAELVRGEARVVRRGVVTVGEREIEYDELVVATGSNPSLPPLVPA